MTAAGRGETGGASAGRGFALIASAILAGVVMAACTQPPNGSLSVTPGPDATSSLVPAQDATPVPSGDGAAPVDSQGASPHGPSISGAPQVSGLPMVSPPHDAASDAPAAS